MKKENNYPVPTYWMELNSLDTQKCVSVVSTHLQLQGNQKLGGAYSMHNDCNSESARP